MRRVDFVVLVVCLGCFLLIIIVGFTGMGLGIVEIASFFGGRFYRIEIGFVGCLFEFELLCCLFFGVFGVVVLFLLVVVVIKGFVFVFVLVLFGFLALVGGWRFRLRCLWSVWWRFLVCVSLICCCCLSFGGAGVFAVGGGIGSVVCRR